MFRRKLNNNTKAEGFLGAIVLVIGVFLTIAVMSIVAFSFLSATGDAYEFTDTQDIVLATTTEYIAISNNNPASETIRVQAYNTSSSAWEAIPTANYTYISANNTVSVDPGPLNATNNNQLRATYDMTGYGANNDVITYAVIVFGLAVIIPLIMVGGLMLRSLGFFGGGKV